MFQESRIETFMQEIQNVSLNVFVILFWDVCYNVYSLHDSTISQSSSRSLVLLLNHLLNIIVVSPCYPLQLQLLETVLLKSAEYKLRYRSL